MQQNRQQQVQKALQDFYKNPVARVSLELFFSIAAVIFFAVFAIKPTLTTMSELIKEIQDKRTLDEQLAEKIASLNTAQSQYEKYSSQFYLLDEALPKKASLVESLKIIEKIASENGLVIKGINVSDVPDEMNGADPATAERQNLTLNIDVLGDYVDLRQFIEDIINSRRMMIVDQVNFSMDSGRYQQNLAAIVRINLPYYSNGENK